jgi:hypothetical protein
MTQESIALHFAEGVRDDRRKCGFALREGCRMTEESMALHFADGVGMKIGKCELCERLPL